MQLSIIIVNYNVHFFLEQCLLSISRAIADLQAEVFVVDNNSKDGSVAMVKEKFPFVHLIANADNPGFSKANNQAIKLAKGAYILLLNPDTVVEEDTFKKCIEFAQKHPDCGGLGIKMIDGSGRFLPESKRGFTTPWVAFCKTFGLSKFFPKSKIFNRYHLGYLDENQNHEVDVLAGAFMMLRKTTLDKIGLLDEAFFMYGEDIDLSYRIQKGGYKNYYFADSTIIHYKGESTKKGSLNYVRIFYNAMIIFAKKHFKGKQAWIFVKMLELAIYFRASLTLLGNIFRKMWLPILDGLIMISGFFVLKNFWANYHFQNPDYFNSPLFYYFNLPFYLIFWFGSIVLNGGYDKPLKISKLIKGLILGTVFLTATYGLLPENFRFSRALIVLSTFWALIFTVLLRVFLHFLKFKNLDLDSVQEPNLAIVGSEKESKIVLDLLQEVGAQKKLIGIVSPNQSVNEASNLGEIAQLKELIVLYRIDEVIFCSSEISYHQIIFWMEKLKNKVSFKIFPEKSQSIIGSSSKNSQGELYTLSLKYRIAQPMNRRNKRVFDISTAILLGLLLPVYLLFVKNKFLFIQNWISVLIGRKTWVSYQANNLTNQLPVIKYGVFEPTIRIPVDLKSEMTTQRINFLYARDYNVALDWEIFQKGLRNIIS